MKRATEDAIRITGVNSNIMTTFWGANQRFFLQLGIAFKVCGKPEEPAAKSSCHQPLGLVGSTAFSRLVLFVPRANFCFFL